MALTDFPRIECSVTFLPTSEGGRTVVPSLLSGVYRPHFVVGDPNQRKATIGRRTIDGKVYENVSDENYLGVQFENSSAELVAGIEFNAAVIPMYYLEPAVDYSGLRPGATFTIREGAKIVGYGTVRRWLAPLEKK